MIARADQILKIGNAYMVGRVVPEEKGKETDRTGSSLLFVVRLLEEEVGG